ncbi:MAG: polyprenyl synthetase family protein [Rhodospirillaceae bacterium]|nr:polyprenyl synthetase family protein [Rhodospirillaceae bacterium]
MDTLKHAMAEAAEAMERELDRLIPRGDGHERRLYEAMRYASLEGGKRLRPFLVLESARLFDVPRARALRAAAAIEFVHCYSLVHDDLPAMDDDDLRRGRPTTHKKFDDATAILAGDALLTLAFEVLADPDTHPDGGVRAELVAALAAGAGATGMVGGQMFDLEAEKHGRTYSLDDITRLQSMKTGRLIGFSCQAGAILGQAAPAQRRALDRYAEALGLAFQIADDLLDAEGTEAEVGKKVGKDAAAGKATFITYLGLDGARRRAQELAAEAAGHLDLFAVKAQILSNVAQFVVERRA